MSFGNFGGFGSNNNQSSGSFGGFGSNAGGFGQNANTSGSGLFGGGSNNTNTGGFGSGAFGAAATTPGGLFGTSNANANTNTTGSAFGGFGNTGASNTATSAFGGNSAAGGLFGNANKPGFGATNTGTSLFGGNTNTGNASNTGSAFGGFGSGNLLGGGGTTGAGDPPGTAVTPFQAFTEKEPNSSTNQSNAFQNICFQDPYKKWSSDELRLVDYAQGRRHGNASGAGAFGVGSGFGGFGSTNTAAGANTTGQATGGFGSTANTTGGALFGNNTNASNTAGGFGTGAFGGNTGTNTAAGGLFGGANKTAGGGLFGNSTQNASGGGMFGNNAASTGGFGSGATNTNTGGVFGSANTNTSAGGLFGANNQQQAKPQGAGFSFGNANNATSGGFGSGTTNNAFGSLNTNTNTTGGGLFGNTNTQNTASGGLFGNAAASNTNNAQQNTTSAFGGFGQQNAAQQQGGLFGGNQQKPAGGGLFGSSTTNTNAGGGGLFGNTSNQQQGGGLFGSNAAAQTNPNTAGGGLFGGLGSNTQNQQSTGLGGGLFGGANDQQKPGGLFGASTANAGSSLFGGQGNQNQGSSLFGGNALNQQQNNAGLGASLLGNSQQASVGPQGLTANLSDISAYGSPALFANIGGNEVPNPGPLAVPLSGNPKPRRPGILPLNKLTPASSTRFGTPQKRGFGFSYSSYGALNGTNSINGGASTNNLGRGLLGASTSSALGKSTSSGTLRRNYNTEDSILIPGAFSNTNNNRWFGSSGSKKLVINRDLRSDLFSTPSKDKPAADSTGTRKLSKRVSFDTGIEEEDETPSRNALPAPGDGSSPAAEAGARSGKAANLTNGSRTPDMEQVRDNQLSVVEEEDVATPDSVTNGFDNAPGNYWMEPSREEIQNMNRVQRQKIDNFTVGRENVGSISFKIPVDISSIDLDDMCGGIIQLEPRSATVYPVSAKKPPVGKGLNVPARIALEQSWPRGNRDKRIATDPKRLNKHIERLKRIMDTTFESYDADTGIWTFSVEHFTTYGLDDSDEDSDDDITQDMPMLVIPQTLAMTSAPSAGINADREKRGFPGAFDEQAEASSQVQTTAQPFLGVSSADSAALDVNFSMENDYAGEGGAEYGMSEDEELARSSTGQHLAAEHDDSSSEGGQETKKSAPGGILRARMRAMKHSVGPVKLEVADGNDWTGMLRKSVNPVKRDRHLLREMVDSPGRKSVRFRNLNDDEERDFRKSSIWGKSLSRPEKTAGFGASTMGMDQGQGFATSIDLMNSLFEKPKPQPWPYERQDKVLTAEDGERAFHDASKPTWGPDETLVMARFADVATMRRSLRGGSDILAVQRTNVQTDRQDLCIARLAAEPTKTLLQSQDLLTEIDVADGVPFARLNLDDSGLRRMFHHKNMNQAASLHEKQVWELASILFDSFTGPTSQDSEQLTRRNKLSQFWTDLVEQASSTAVSLAATSEEKAVACLAGHRIPEACKFLLDSKNFRLGTLIPLIGTSDAAKKDMKEQIKAWHDSKMLSEFSEAIRAMYELLSGNVCVCEGLKGVPVEDRMDSFVISSKFGLDWRQSFGLRLWYALSNQDDITAAVDKFKDDIDQDREGLPQPWYVEQGLSPLWDDADASSRQDLLWGLLQLYADPNTDLEAVLRPENSQLSPLDSRLRWQLGLALTATGRVTYGKDKDEKADAATLAYACQLTGAGEWLEAIYVLLHLNHATARKKAIQEQLCRHAGLIGAESGTVFNVLTEKYRIPAEWVWEALALYMRSVKKDARAEVHCLLRSGSLVEAHRVLVAQVAPQAIIARDYAGLQALISQFQESSAAISDWALGGEIYSHFLQLVQCRATRESAPAGLLEKLLAGLNALKESGAEDDIVRYAAVSDMADETAKEIIQTTRQKKVSPIEVSMPSAVVPLLTTNVQDGELRLRILNLPLTQDRLLAYSVDLSLDRYREIMSH
ncbi:Nucleoporin nup189 [Escovopsis weberi]|uniref:Nucleoporin nup189 n=1 Tax=Escovopsis weberi TaxID=150374 RepID=A0A0M9VS80_ESCWE|nr:Nucleoporin nup189 [Escovopsis weberi]